MPFDKETAARLESLYPEHLEEAFRGTFTFDPVTVEPTQNMFDQDAFHATVVYDGDSRMLDPAKLNNISSLMTEKAVELDVENTLIESYVDSREYAGPVHQRPVLCRRILGLPGRWREAFRPSHQQRQDPHLRVPANIFITMTSTGRLDVIRYKQTEPKGRLLLPHHLSEQRPRVERIRPRRQRTPGLHYQALPSLWTQQEIPSQVGQTRGLRSLRRRLRRHARLADRQAAVLPDRRRLSRLQPSREPGADVVTPMLERPNSLLAPGLTNLKIRLKYRIRHSS